MSGQWCGTSAEVFESVRAGQQYVNVLCTEHHFWTPGAKWTEITENSASHVPAIVYVVSTRSPSELDCVVRVNEDALRAMVHNRRADDYETTCDYAHSKCCQCVFSELLDMIFNDIGRQLRVALTAASKRSMGAKLNKYKLQRDFIHQFSKKMQSLFPACHHQWRRGGG